MYDLRRKSMKDDGEEVKEAKNHKKSIKNAISVLQVQMKRKVEPAEVEPTEVVQVHSVEEPPRKKRGRPPRPRPISVSSSSEESPIIISPSPIVLVPITSTLSSSSPFSSSESSQSPTTTPVKQKRGRKPKNPKPELVLISSGENPDEMSQSLKSEVEEILLKKEFLTTTPVHSSSLSSSNSVKNTSLLCDSPPISPTREGTNKKKSLEEELFSIEGLLARSEKIDNSATWSWGLIEEVEREESRLSYQQNKERVEEEEKKLEEEEKTLDFMLKDSPLSMIEKEEPLDELICTWLL